MPLKVVSVPVDDTAFKDFLALFEKYQEALKSMPDDWAKVGGAIEKSGAGFGEMAALMLAQAEMLHRITTEHRELERSASGYERAMSRARKEVKEIASGIASTTRELLKWSGITGLLGVGGLFGLEHLASNASSLRVAGLGNNVDPGTLQALRVNLGRVIDPSAALNNIWSAQHDVTKQVQLWSMGLGADVHATPDRTLLDVIEAANRTYQGAKASGSLGMLENLPAWQAITGVLGDQAARTYGNMSPAEIAETRRNVARDQKSFEYRPGELDAWYKLDRQLDRAGTAIGHDFLGALDKLTLPLGNLSESVVGLVHDFLDSKLLKDGIDALADGVKWLDGEIKDPAFEQGIISFVEGIKNAALAIPSFLKAIGLISDTSGSATDNAAGTVGTGAVVGAGAGAYLGGRVAGIPGVVVGAGLGGIAGAAMPGMSRANKELADQGYAFNPMGAPVPLGTASNRAAFDSATTITDPTIAAAASIIAWRESKDQDVWNYKHWLAPNYWTAGGIYQITDGNWKSYGPAAGVDLNQYPHAKGAPRQLQDAVFAAMYRKNGYAPWDAAHGGSIASDQAFRAEMQQRLSAKPANSDTSFDKDAYFAAYRHIIDRIRGGNEPAPRKPQAAAAPPQQMKLILENRTGADVNISASQGALAW